MLLTDGLVCLVSNWRLVFSFWSTNFHKRKLKRNTKAKNCAARLIQQFPVKLCSESPETILVKLYKNWAVIYLIALEIDDRCECSHDTTGKMT